MILQALNDLYDRIPDAPPYGFARKPVSFTLLLDARGQLLDVQDERTPEAKRLVPKSLIVPDIMQKRAVNVLPNLACDNSAYVLGRDNKDNPRRAELCFASFRRLHRRLANDLCQPAANAAAAFLDSWEPERAIGLKQADELLGGGNIVFRLQGAHEYLHDLPSVAEWWQRFLDEDGEAGVAECLVTGRTARIARLHPAIKGVRGCQTTGGSLVSFNLDAFESYGKQQNRNAPIGRAAAFRYVSAVNWLLDRRNDRVVQIGDATTVFWTAKPSPVEDVFGDLLNTPEDLSRLETLEAILNTVARGRHPPELGDGSTPFYVLGLSPNAARISVRFWLMSSAEEILRRVARHFEDLRIVQRWPSDRALPPLWLLLRQLAARGDDQNIAPLLAGATTRAILGGGAYPAMLLECAIRRIRAHDDGGQRGGDAVSYLRASLIKAYLNRKLRLHNRKEVTVSLDPTRTDPAYRLGRLFAVLEIVQRDALGDPGASITDRYYSSASATPAVVFPRLIRLSQHHLGKLDSPHRISRERLIQDICDGLAAFPAHLGLEDQGLFALGYYHQKKNVYTKKDAKGE